MDMRIAKIEYLNNDHSSINYEYYNYDVQGNVIATYERVQNLQEDQLKLVGHHIYGANRLGVQNSGKELKQRSVVSVPQGGSIDVELSENIVWGSVQSTSYDKTQRIVEDKRYELANHLGNVLVVVTDRKVPLTPTTYTADVVSFSDYSPYGVQLDQRHGDAIEGKYKYGFQGQETDDEIKGKGNSVNYKYRMHDPRIGRFFAIDPLTAKYPWYTPYQFSGNRVVDAVELEGLEPKKAGTELGQYEIAPSGTDPNGASYGWTWAESTSITGKTEWVQGESTTFDSNGGKPITDSNGDSKYNDRPDNVSLSTQTTQAMFSNSSLFEFFYDAMFIGTSGVDSKVGAKMANHFKTGAGEILYWYSNSILSKEIGSSDEFISYAHNFEKAAMDYFDQHGSLDGFKLIGENKLQNEPNLNGESVFLTTTIGGVQKVSASITKISSTQIEVLYSVIDRFGAGTNDQSGKKQFFPGLVEMYVLQHFRATEKYYRPFKNFIYIKREGGLMGENLNTR